MESELKELKKGETYTLAQLQEFVSENEDTLILSQENAVFGSTKANRPNNFKVYDIGYGNSEMCSDNLKGFSIFTKDITVYCIKHTM